MTQEEIDETHDIEIVADKDGPQGSVWVYFCKRCHDWDYVINKNDPKHFQRSCKDNLMRKALR